MSIVQIVQNYRGIAHSSIFVKLFDYIVLERYCVYDLYNNKLIYE